ncbi:MAG: hypothetical protein J5553_05145, partial [Verrucomicrobia bacterium]|nr:hypothetical protein [Verrucomicrobiota bacterium]
MVKEASDENKFVAPESKSKFPRILSTSFVDPALILAELVCPENVELLLIVMFSSLRSKTDRPSLPPP